MPSQATTDQPTNYLEQSGPLRAQQGYKVIPIWQGTKMPGFKGWQKRGIPTTEQIDTWVAEGYEGMGIICGDGVCAVDIDVLDELQAKLAVDKVAEITGDVTENPERVGSHPKRLVVLGTHDSFRKLMSDMYRSPDGKTHRVEVLTSGQQFVSDAIHPGTGKPYEWVNKLCDKGALNLVTERQLRELILWWQSQVPDDWEMIKEGNVESAEPRPALTLSDEDFMRRLKAKVADITEDEIRLQLQHLAMYRPGCGSYDYWFRVGQALWHQFEGSQEGFDLWDEFSQFFDSYDFGELEMKWESQLDWRKFSTPVTYATILRDHKNLMASLDIDEIDDRMKADNDDLAWLMKNAIIPENFDQFDSADDWLIEGCLPSVGVGFIYGQPDAYKSFLALDIACSIAAGTRSAVGEPTRKGAVLYIAGEGHQDIVRRIMAWAQYNGVNPLDIQITVTTGARLMDTPEGRTAVIEHARRICRLRGTPLRAVVMDTLARNSQGEENNGQDMSAFIAGADALRDEFDCCVTALHHVPKGNGEQLRGHSSLSGAADFQYLLERKGEGVIVRNTKMKYGRRPDDRAFIPHEIEVLGAKKRTDGSHQTSLVLREVNLSDNQSESWG